MTAPNIASTVPFVLRRSAAFCFGAAIPSLSSSFSTASSCSASADAATSTLYHPDSSRSASPTAKTPRPLARLHIRDTRAQAHVTSSAAVSRAASTATFAQADMGQKENDGTNECGKPPMLQGPEAARRDDTPYMDEINTLLRHPALYESVLAPRFPIVLCHGLYGFDVRGPAFFRLHYWGDLLKVLRGKIGAEVFVTAVPGTGAIKDRAKVLHKVLEATEGVKGRDLNFLGHSMGGLDARYLISNIQPETYYPRSLTTLSTPHRGSEFMSWCRANIGIGTQFDEASEAAAKAAHESLEEEVKVLPFSLKEPILIRPSLDPDRQREKDRQAKILKDQAKEEADKVKASVASSGGKLAGLPGTLTASVSGYLLDLLDSPAYANLSPAFLRDVFNPGTPDRPDVRYFSIAARTDKISIWHPLWLPKMVLDGAESARLAAGKGPSDPRWRGNDGLVTVESAKWGEFLGTLDAADHWEIRGSSGLSNAIESARAVAEATNISSHEAPDKSKDAKKKTSWSWQDVYRLVGNSGSGKGSAEVVEAPTGQRSTEDQSALTAVVGWIVKALPGSKGASNSAVNAKAATNGVLDDTTRLLFGAPASKRASSTDASRSSVATPSAQSAKLKPGKFDLERMALALCRKLHKEGL